MPQAAAPLKIVQINNYGFIRGGADRYCLDLGALLARHGHHVSYLCSADERNVIDSRYAVRGIDIERPTLLDVPEFLYSVRARRRLVELIESERPDLAHLHIYYGQLTASVLSVLRRYSIPVVQTLHEYKLLCPVATMVRAGRFCDECASGSPWPAARHRCNRGQIGRSLVTALEAAIARRLGAWHHVHHFIAVSDFVRSTMIRYGMPPDRITTVHNFVDTDSWTPGEGPGEYFLYLGRLESIKGVMTMLQAMSLVPSARLIVAGAGAALGAMKEYMACHRLQNVMLTGFKIGAELRALIRACRCVLAPSEWHETFGLVLTEAFACARPVIASRIGGMTEVVDEGRDGLLFEPGNVQELARAIGWMWANPAAALRMGANGRAKIVQRFSPDRHYATVMQVYEKVLGR